MRNIDWEEFYGLYYFCSLIYALPYTFLFKFQIYVIILMEGNERVADSDLDLLAERFVNAIIKENRTSAPIVVVGGGELDRMYIFGRMQSKLETRGQKVDLGVSAALEKGDPRYSIDIGWYIDLIKKEGKVPSI